MARLLLLAAAGLTLSAGRSIVEYPLEVRKQNVLRLSQQACDECLTMEDFYKEHPVAFILFYERTLRSPNRYKLAIINAFLAACADLRWSLVTCGIVDIVSDREYAERYIDPMTAPGHIIIRDGSPLPTERQQVEALLKKPGDKDTILSHVRNALSPGEPDGLDTSAEVSTTHSLARLLQQYHVVVAYSAGSLDAAEAFRATVQKALLRGALPFEVPRQEGEPEPKPGSKRWRRDRKKRRVRFVAVRDRAAAAAGLEADGAVVSFVGGKRQAERGAELSISSPTKAKEVVEVLGQAVAQASKAVSGSTPHSEL